MNDAPQPARLPAVVTIAALYGAGGSVVGPRVAERLGVQFLDRAIPSAVAKRAGLPEAAVADVDEKPRSGWQRLLAILGRASSATGASAQVERLDLEERRLRAEIEEFLAHASRAGPPCSTRAIPMARFSGTAVEGHPRQQREADRRAGRRSPLRLPVEPGVRDDEDRGAGGEGNPGTPRILTEGVLEELDATAVRSAPEANASRAAVTALEGGRQIAIQAPSGSALEAITAYSAALSV
jgi:hypothetical protein